MGDNQDSSFDSRHFGYISDERLLGIVSRRVLPGTQERSLAARA